MKLQRKLKGYKLLVNLDSLEFKQEPEYEYVLIESKLKQFLKIQNLLVLLLLPVFPLVALYYTQQKVFIIISTILTIVFALPLIFEICIIFDTNKE
jgi:membrane protein YdbS with pleckstrin-like domain